MEAGFVPEVAAFQWPPFNRPFMTVLEVIERYWQVAGTRQRLACVLRPGFETPG
jgi:hypothetical protein